MLSSTKRRKYRDLRERIDAERDEIVTETRRRKRVHDAVAAELRQAFRMLKKEPHAQGLSLADMQGRTGMSRSAISRLENDESANPTIETLIRYAEALGKELAITLTDRTS
ncbi:MAG TPA: helix-turn-helix transcriptional regulator [Vicinamibacteria bacterium]|nr:helix-turn-helix transcriptional regulator [Vicinamibacteria bacterium]